MKADYGIGARRAGDPCVADYDKKTIGVGGRVAPGTKRAGNPRVMDVPDELFKGDPSHWIGKAIKRPGALHAQLGVPQGKKIPAKKMAAARSGKEGPLAEKRASLAKTLSKF